MPEPPCLEGVHWRVLKDPVKVAPSQLRALEQLLIKRVDPGTCRRRTAGKVTSSGDRIAVNRPLQTIRQQHKVVYCECNDWRSASEKDRDYCERSDRQRGVYRCSGEFCR
jgi:Eukaryotic-type carbonic anhydrase